MKRKSDLQTLRQQLRSDGISLTKVSDVEFYGNGWDVTITYVREIGIDDVEFSVENIPQILPGGGWRTGVQQLVTRRVVRLA